jgi:hypothetical protein
MVNTGVCGASLRRFTAEPQENAKVIAENSAPSSFSLVLCGEIKLALRNHSQFQIPIHYSPFTIHYFTIHYFTTLTMPAP